MAINITIKIIKYSTQKKKNNIDFFVTIWVVFFVRALACVCVIPPPPAPLYRGLGGGGYDEQVQNG